jgi:hypothetical protein
MSKWRSLGAIPPTRLVDARLEAHHAAQLLAIGVGRSLLPAREDDSHTSLTWDPDGRRWFGPEIPGTDSFRAELRPENLTLSLARPRGKERRELPLAGRTSTEALEWLREQVAGLGGEAARISLESHYEIPDRAVADGSPFRQSEELVEVSRYFQNAHRLFRELVEVEPGASAVATWPHHFDMATLIQLVPEKGGDARSVGVGLSAGDEHYAEPYLYVSPYPYPAVARLRALAPPGHWHTEGFVAAILPAQRIVHAGSGSEQESTAREFLRAALHESRSLLLVSSDSGFAKES